MACQGYAGRGRAPPLTGQGEAFGNARYRVEVFAIGMPAGSRRLLGAISMRSVLPGGNDNRPVNGQQPLEFMMSKINEVFSAEPIIVDRERLRVEAFQCSTRQRDVLQYAIAAYGFVLQSKLISAAQKRFSFAGFASAIGEVFDVQYGRHAEVVGVLLALEQSQGAIAGRPVAVCGIA